MQLEEIIHLFEDEFGAHKHKFDVIDLVGADTKKSKDQRI